MVAGQRPYPSRNEKHRIEFLLSGDSHDQEPLLQPRPPLPSPSHQRLASQERLQYGAPPTYTQAAAERLRGRAESPFTESTPRPPMSPTPSASSPISVSSVPSPIWSEQKLGAKPEPEPDRTAHFRSKSVKLEAARPSYERPSSVNGHHEHQHQKRLIPGRKY